MFLPFPIIVLIILWLPVAPVSTTGKRPHEKTSVPRQSSSSQLPQHIGLHHLQPSPPLSNFLIQHQEDSPHQSYQLSDYAEGLEIPNFQSFGVGHSNIGPSSTGSQPVGSSSQLDHHISHDWDWNDILTEDVQPDALPASGPNSYEDYISDNYPFGTMELNPLLSESSKFAHQQIDNKSPSPIGQVSNSAPNAAEHFEPPAIQIKLHPNLSEHPTTHVLESDPKINNISSTEAKGKGVAAHHHTETMWNSQVSHNEVAIDPKTLEKLDPDDSDDNLRKFFLYYRNEPIGPQKGKQMAKCRVCGKIYERQNGGTNGMVFHLKAHTELWTKYDKAKKQIVLKKQQRKRPDGSVTIDPEEYDKLNTEKPEYSLQKYFDFYITDDIGGEKGQKKARCRICKKVLARPKGSINGMTYHLMVPHEEFFKLYDDARKNLDLKNKRISQAASSASIGIDAYRMLNQSKSQYSLQKYFDYKRADKTAKCRICNEEVEKQQGKIDSLIIGHLKGRHDEFFQMYESSMLKKELKKQQKKCPRGGHDEVGNDNDYDDEENEREQEPNASQSQPVMISFAEPVNLRKKPRKNG